MKLRWPAREPKPLEEHEIDEDPEMGDPLDAGPESYQADPDDKDGLGDLPEDADPVGQY